MDSKQSRWEVAAWLLTIALFFFAFAISIFVENYTTSGGAPVSLGIGFLTPAIIAIFFLCIFITYFRRHPTEDAIKREDIQKIANTLDDIKKILMDMRDGKK